MLRHSDHRESFDLSQKTCVKIQTIRKFRGKGMGRERQIQSCAFAERKHGAK
jgi:hypothetical protein